MKIKHPRCFRDQALLIKYSSMPAPEKFHQLKQLLQQMNTEYGTLIYDEGFFRKCSNLRRTYEEIEVLAKLA